MEWQVGCSKVDLDVPLAGVRFFGYGHIPQVGSGIEQPVYARAFICSGEEGHFVFVNCDLGMVSLCTYQQVCAAVQLALPGVYSPANICLSANHTHSSPGSYSPYNFYSIATAHYSSAMAKIVTVGITKAIVEAHRAKQAGHAKLKMGQLTTSSINRSLAAYRANPLKEREARQYSFNPNMVQLELYDHEENLLGLLNWFAVHGTSYDKSNTLLSGDNKGYASWKVEETLGNNVVAAFAQSNSGDISPNLRPGRDGLLRGEGSTPRESVKIIGERQAQKALQLLEEDAPKLEGIVESAMTYVDFNWCPVNTTFSATGKVEHTSPAILGQNFMCGTDDGRGPAWFEAGTHEHKTLVRLIADNLSDISNAVESAQAPKKSFVALGRARGEWVPHVLPMQIFRLGQFAVGTCPFEVTTIAGARIEEQMLRELKSCGIETTVLACLCNGYASYAATSEEYDMQLYEGASTLFGREQLGAMLQSYHYLAKGILRSAPAQLGLQPDIVQPTALFTLPDKIPRIDAAPRGLDFGEVTTQPSHHYHRGEVVKATFCGANPANYRGQSDPVFVVDRLEDGAWQPWMDYRHWATRFYWTRKKVVFSDCVCWWEIGEDSPPGTYRFRHHGQARKAFRRPFAYRGTTRPFQLLDS